MVDDNPGDIRFVEEAFSASQLAPAIHSVKTREEALAFIHRRGEYEDSPELDVVLLDWNLSQTTSGEVLSALQSARPETPVVVMTGTKSEINGAKSELPQVDRYIEKPTVPQRYVDVLKPYLTER
ncbi:response regulator [Halosimplex aquaticum]|uniref:Response regulator n=1 Tax=Halosimplex aquaticum TaxID=3026162 RepID=A0ABD5YBD9_9EURY|nr:response regulator [Halosimplex aquaticum]